MDCACREYRSCQFVEVELGCIGADCTAVDGNTINGGDDNEFAAVNGVFTFVDANRGDVNNDGLRANAGETGNGE